MNKLCNRILLDLNSNENSLLKIIKALKGTNAASSKNWLERQRRDPYVKRAIKESYRARSAFKLIEIDNKYNFLKPGHVIVDIGAAPGSWSQVAVKKTNSDAKGMIYIHIYIGLFYLKILLPMIFVSNFSL